MQKQRVSVILDISSNEELLPLNLVDIESYMSKLGLEYEIFVLSEKLEVENALKKFSKILDNKRLSTDRDSNLGQRVLGRLSGEACVLLRGGEMPTFSSFKIMISSIYPMKENGYEIVFGSSVDKSAMGRLAWFIGLLLRLPIKLNAYSPVVIFHNAIASSVMSLQKFGGMSFDIELAILSQKMGYRSKQFTVDLVDGRAARISPRSLVRAIYDAIKIKLLVLRDVYRLENAHLN